MSLFKFEIKMLEQDSLFHNSFVYEAQNAFVKGDKMSHNFHLLTMPRDRRSFQGLNMQYTVISSSLFHMFIREDRKTVNLMEKSYSQRQKQWKSQYGLNTV